MKLTKNQLLNKFNCLKKFENQKWLAEEAIKEDCNYKELPLKCSLELIKNTIEFIHQTRFSNRWEEGFSIKCRLEQIQDLLIFFCEDTEEEKTKKGINIHQQFPIQEKPID